MQQYSRNRLLQDVAALNISRILLTIFLRGCIMDWYGYYFLSLRCGLGCRFVIKKYILVNKNFLFNFYGNYIWFGWSLKLSHWVEQIPIVYSMVFKTQQLTFCTSPYDGPNRLFGIWNHSTWLTCNDYNGEDFFWFRCKSYKRGEN